MAKRQTQVKGDLYLCRDRYQWWFAERIIHKDGHPMYDPVTGYFRELSGAFEDLGKREARSVEAESVPELMEALKHHETVMRELAEEIMEALKE